MDWLGSTLSFLLCTGLVLPLLPFFWKPGEFVWVATVATIIGFSGYLGWVYTRESPAPKFEKNTVPLMRSLGRQFGRILRGLR